MQIQDQHTIDSVLAGDRDAYANLVNRYRDRLYALAFTKTGDYAVAEDIVQQAFLDAFMKLEDLQHKDRFQPWLVRIMLNLCRQWVEKKNRHAGYNELYRMELDRGNEFRDVTPEKMIMEQEMREKVLQAVAGLEPDFREVIVLRFMEDMSYREISEHLEIPETTVQGRLRLAREQLQGDLMPIVGDVLKDERPTETLTQRVMAALPPVMFQPSNDAPIDTIADPLTAAEAPGTTGILVKAGATILAAGLGAFMLWYLPPGFLEPPDVSGQTGTAAVMQPPDGPADWIQQDVAAYIASVDRVYADYLTEHPAVRGVLKVELSVTGSGRVDEAIPLEDTMGDMNFTEMMIARLKQWQFHPPEGFSGADIMVTMPFTPRFNNPKSTSE